MPGILSFDSFRKGFPQWLKHFHRLEVRGIRNLPKKGSAIVACNHSGSWDYDNLSLMSAFDHFKTNNPARKKIWLCYDDKHAKSPHVQRFSPIPINLSGKGIPYDFVDKLVKNGEVIAIMPEGHCATIGEGYRLWKFYPGVIKLHLRYKIPIIPTANIGFVKATPKISTVYNPNKVPCWENSKYAPFVLPKKLIIHFGKPVSFEEYYDKAVDKETLSHLSMLLRRKVKETIAIYREGVTWNNPYGKKTNNYKRNKK